MHACSSGSSSRTTRRVVLGTTVFSAKHPRPSRLNSPRRRHVWRRLLDHLADEFVAERQRELVRPRRPRVPAVQVKVRAADGRSANPDQRLTGGETRQGPLLELDTAGSGMAFDEKSSFHNDRCQARWRCLLAPAEGGICARRPAPRRLETAVASD